MLRLITGRAGAGKTALVMDEIRRAALSGEGGRVLLVPEQYSHEAERELARACRFSRRCCPSRALRGSWRPSWARAGPGAWTRAAACCAWRWRWTPSTRGCGSTPGRGARRSCRPSCSPPWTSSPQQGSTSRSSWRRRPARAERSAKSSRTSPSSWAPSAPPQAQAGRTPRTASPSSCAACRRAASPAPDRSMWTASRTSRESR